MLIRKSLWWKGRLNKIMALAIGDIKSPRCLGHYCCICFPLNILSIRARLFFFPNAKKKQKKKKSRWLGMYAIFTSSNIYHLILQSLLRDCSQVPLPMGFSRQEYWRGCHFLLQEIFHIQGSNLCPPHWKQILYQLSHQGSPLRDVSYVAWVKFTI